MFICASVYVYMCLLMCFHVSVYLSESLWVVYSLCYCVSENAFVCVCLCPCTVVGASLGVILRGRGLPVHAYLPVASLGHWHPVELSLVVSVVHPTKHHHTALLFVSVERSEGGNPWRTVTAALSESCACPPIKALIRSPRRDAEIVSRSD